MSLLQGMGHVKLVETKLRYLIDHFIVPFDTHSSLLEAIEELNSLRTQIDNPRNITITRERYNELLKNEEALSILRNKIRTSKDLKHEKRPKTLRQHQTVRLS